MRIFGVNRWGRSVRKQNTFIRKDVMRTPPPSCVLSCLSVVYRGISGKWCRDVSFVSCINATSLLCLGINCFSG